jgi:hypothetical protein
MDPLSPSNINPSWSTSPPRSRTSTSTSNASSTTPTRALTRPPGQPASSPFRGTTAGASSVPNHRGQDINQPYSHSSQTQTQSSYQGQSQAQGQGQNQYQNQQKTPIRDPKVFGAPGMGLTSPPGSASASAGSGSGTGSLQYGRGTPGNGSGNGNRNGNGNAGEKQPPFLRVRLGVLERNRKDLLVRFDASVSLLDRLWCGGIFAIAGEGTAAVVVDAGMLDGVVLRAIVAGSGQ